MRNAFTVRAVVFGVLGGVLAAGLAGPAGAVQWDGSASDNWFVGGNWDSGVVPTSGAVDLNVTLPNATRIGGGSASASTLTLGSTGNGALTIAGGGTLTQFGLGTIGQTGGRSGSVTVDGAGSAWTMNGSGGNLYLGNSGSGSLMVRNGAAVTNGFGIIGRLGGSSGVATRWARWQLRRGLREMGARGGCRR